MAHAFWIALIDIKQGKGRGEDTCNLLMLRRNSHQNSANEMRIWGIPTTPSLIPSEAPPTVFLDFGTGNCFVTLLLRDDLDQF